MADQEVGLADQIAMFCAMTGADPQTAADMLANSGGDLNLAINDFLEGGDNGGGSGGGGSGNAPPAASGVGADDDDNDEDEDDDEDDDDDNDDDDEFAEGNVLLTYDDNNSNATTPPPSKRAKVEMRAAPKLTDSSDATKAGLRALFALNSSPTDLGDKLHRMIDDRKSSWAYGDDRSLSYLLSCYARLCASEAQAAADVAAAVSFSAVAAVEAKCFPLAVLLHHARAILLSGEAHDDGLGLFEQQTDSELNKMLASKNPHASAFMTAVHRSMSDIELDQVYLAPLEELLKRCASATVSLPGAASASKSSRSVDWRAAMREAEALFGLVGSGGGALKGLPQGEAVRKCLGRRMAEEAALLRSGKWSGRDAEAQGCLRLFGPSVPGLLTKGRPTASSSPLHHCDAASIASVHREVHAMQTHLRLVFTAALVKDAEIRTYALDWVAAVTMANELVLKDLKSRDPHKMMAAQSRRSGDACLINLTAVLLQLCEPFLTDPKKHDGYARFDPKWCDRELARRAPLPAAVQAYKLHKLKRTVDAGEAAGSSKRKEEVGAAKDVAMPDVSAGDGKAEEEDELAQAIRLSLVASNSPSAGPSSSAGPDGFSKASDASATTASAAALAMDFHFVTECFFLALGALHAALLPALDQAQKVLDDLHRKARLPLLPPDAAPSQYSSQLQQIQLAGLGTLQAVAVAYKCFADSEKLQTLHGHLEALTAAWLLHLTSAPEPEGSFSRLPEYAASNACALVRHLAYTNPQTLRSATWGAALVSRFLCEMAGRRDLITSPFLRYQLVEALYTLAQIDEHNDQMGASRGGLLGSSQSLPLFDLVDSQAAAVVQPALLALYVELGMHTNTEAVTDKNYQRMTLMTVLRRLWRAPTAWQALQTLSKEETSGASNSSGSPPPSSSSASFGEFATTLVKENIFLLDDALGRLTDVKKFETEKADEQAWNAQPPKQRAEREKRLEEFRRTAKSFLGLGKLTLQALGQLVSDSIIGHAFTDVPDRSHKMANMLVGFLRRLCGPECQGLNVSGREKLGWDPRRVLSDTTSLLLACHKSKPAFLDDLKESDSYERTILERAYHLLSTKCKVEFAPMQLELLEQVLRTLDGGDAEGSGGSGAMGHESVCQRAVSASAEARKAESDADLLTRVDGIYTSGMRPQAYGEDDISDGKGGFLHYYRQNIAEAPIGAMSKSKMKRLMKELGKLQKLGDEGALPVAAEASIYLLQEESRSDVLKCLISGPADVNGDSETPYALGLFEFHIFIPPDYPNVPPLVNLQTTGDGMVRFNPNLYSDGKVCLSLLGTWHGEGWTVPTASNFGSTILQVLVSIQSIIMVKNPYFNEPGYADQEGTASGNERSREYNENIRLATMRFAIRDMLKRPPSGLETVVRQHFLLLKPLLQRQLARWLDECQSASNRTVMEKAYTEIFSLIDMVEAKDAAENEVASSSSAMELS